MSIGKMSRRATEVDIGKARKYAAAELPPYALLMSKNARAQMKKKLMSDYFRKNNILPMHLPSPILPKTPNKSR